jgi:Domain of unknown function (DUF4399)
MKKIILPVVIAIAAAACNNNGDKTADNKDTMNHDMHTTSTTVEMPPMPEVPADAKVFFANLKEGQEVKSPLKVEMAVLALSVDTANGKLKPASGHHHILVDIDSIITGEVIKKDSVHIHFGNAQTSAEIPLPPGKHTLTLQFADALHRSYGNRLTHKVTVNVKE